MTRRSAFSLSQWEAFSIFIFKPPDHWKSLCYRIGVPTIVYKGWKQTIWAHFFSTVIFFLLNISVQFAEAGWLLQAQL
jgi:hypothetical protein